MSSPLRHEDRPPLPAYRTHDTDRHMTTAVNICCIQSQAEARLAIDHGAQAVGLVGAMPSGPGPIHDDQIAGIAAPLHDAMITLASSVLGADLATAGRKLHSMGFDHGLNETRRALELAVEAR